MFKWGIYDALVIHLDLDILDCEVKWASVNITMNKASGSDGILEELFKILKDDAVNSAELIISANSENSAVATGLEKISFIPMPKKDSFKEYSKYQIIALILHNSKITLKIPQVRLQLYVNQEHLDVQAGFRKSRGTRDQIANIHWIIKKSRKFKKIIYLCFTDYTKALTVWITMNSEKFLKWWENHYILPVSWETCMWVKKQQLEPYMKKLTGSKLGKEYNKAGYCHHVYLTYMQSTSWEMLGWINHKLQ